MIVPKDENLAVNSCGMRARIILPNLQQRSR